MFSKLKSYWQFGTTFCSIELTTFGGKDVLLSVLATKKKNEFANFQFKKAESFSELSETLPKNQHCYLLINSSKVLIKEISFTENNQKALSKTFPSLSLSDFYFQILKTKAKCYVAICRKSDVDTILKQASSQKIEVLGFQLGFSSLSNLIPLLKETYVITPRYEFAILENEIDSFSENNDQNNSSYTIENIAVVSDYLIPLSGLFYYLSKTKELSSNSTEENKKLLLQQEQKNFFRKGMLTGVGILLFSLLINFFLFNSYYTQQQTKMKELQLLKAQQESYLFRSSILESKERIVQNILNGSSSKSSFYINRIVAFRPASILFDEINFQPLLKAIRVDKTIDYLYDEVMLSGTSNDKNDFSNWIESLENFDWVKSVMVTNFGYSKKYISSFGVKILIRPDETKK